MTTSLRMSCVLASLALLLTTGRGAQGGVTVEDALALAQPVQKDVDIDRPEEAEIAKCTIQAEGKRGWIIRDGSGQILRIFSDTNADNVVDLWCYYKDGIEVYRDIDTNFNKKADQCRWLNSGGSRWGIDANEDGKIDFWKSISPEEVTAELVAAMRQRDRARFERLVLSDTELKALGVRPAKAELLRKKIDVALANFAKFSAGQAVVAAESKWISFGGTQPGVVPAGTDDSTADLTVYENVMAMVETEGKAQPLSIGTLVRVKDNWRLIDLPGTADNGVDPFFIAAARPERSDNVLDGKPTEHMQEIMKALQALPDISSSTPQEHEKRAELLGQLAAEADTPENREQWHRQLADTLSAAVQTGGYKDGIEKLKQLYETLKADPKDAQLATFVQWRWMSAEHGHELATSTGVGNFGDIQTKWIAELKKFVENAPKNPDAAEATMELAIAEEFGGNEEGAIQGYDTIVRDFPDSPVYAKAAGAKRRLTSIGQSIPLKGKLVNGGQAFDLARLKGKAVLIRYWATWCEPGKADIPLLQHLRTKYKDFEVVGVCLDNDPQAMVAFLKQNDPRWPQLFEEGGLDSRFANELGIQNLPTMILIDKEGRVVNRNIRADELEGELQRTLK